MTLPNQKSVAPIYNEDRPPSIAALYNEMRELREEVRELRKLCSRKKEERASSDINANSTRFLPGVGSSLRNSISSRPFSCTGLQNETPRLMEPSSNKNGALNSIDNPFGFRDQLERRTKDRRPMSLFPNVDSYYDVEMAGVADVTKTQASHSPFMSLAPEVRLMIFRELLVCQIPIDLAPISSEQHKNGYLRVRNYAHFRKTIRTRLHPLWLNRTMKAEADECFYSCNEFRFSSVRGWEEAHLFLYHIGDNIRSIRSLGVHIPIDGENRTPTPTGFNPKQEINEQLERCDQGLARPCRTWVGWSVDANFSCCIPFLEKAHGLQSLKLVLPSHYEVNADAIPLDTRSEISGCSESLPSGIKIESYLTGFWDSLKTLTLTHPKLKITLLLLKKQPELDDVPGLPKSFKSPTTPIIPGDSFSHQLAIIQASKFGWEIEEQYYNSRGHYPVAAEVEDEEGDEESSKLDPVRYKFEIKRTVVTP